MNRRGLKFECSSLCFVGVFAGRNSFATASRTRCGRTLRAAGSDNPVDSPLGNRSDLDLLSRVPPRYGTCPACGGDVTIPGLCHVFCDQCGSWVAKQIDGESQMSTRKQTAAKRLTKNSEVPESFGH
mmetsp:Transcript_13534/g.27668  ORF Transcript_13534/g.27668 Transcript_13534/m.27668 type:complete len:127 (+) Transcript_13534:140-520(+)